MSKYKEFWICLETGEINFKKSNTWPSEQYHVIEYSAYEQAQENIDHWQDKVYHATRKVDELELEVKALASSSVGLLEKIQSLKEENKLLKQALEFYAYDTSWYNDYYFGGKTARQTLKKIGKL